MRRVIFASILTLLCAAASWALTPQITLTATAQSILGTSQTISMTVTLVDPNSSGMLKAGTVVVTNFTATSSSGTSVTLGPIYGADVIVDGFGNSNQVYYKVQIFPVSNGIIASTPALQNFYAFIGSGTIDVSSATPLSPSFQTGTSGNVVLPGTLSVSGLITASAGVAGIGPKFQQFTSSGTFTIPAGVTSVKVTVIGGGGGGGGSNGANSGMGGGSGGLGIKYLSGLTPGNTLAVTVGTGGTGVSAASGNNGTASSVASGTQVIVTITANAGGGGSGTISTPAGGGAAGSAGTGGDMNYPGSPGQGFALATEGSTGAAAPIFGGSTPVQINNTGITASVPGAGGGGAQGTGPFAGGAGAAGIVIFEYVQ